MEGGNRDVMGIKEYDKAVISYFHKAEGRAGRLFKFKSITVLYLLV